VQQYRPGCSEDHWVSLRRWFGLQRCLCFLLLCRLRYLRRFHRRHCVSWLFLWRQRRCLRLRRCFSWGLDWRGLRGHGRRVPFWTGRWCRHRAPVLQRWSGLSLSFLNQGRHTIYGEEINRARGGDVWHIYQEIASAIRDTSSSVPLLLWEEIVDVIENSFFDLRIGE